MSQRKESKKYYWLKLDKNFFKSHDIEIIEAMPNGKDYILFYLKLLCESISHEGWLKFNDEIPYNEEMLSVITRTNIDIVRNAIKIFTNLQMMQILDDGTIYMNQVNKMIGSETGWAIQKREQRALLVDNRGQCPTEKEKEKDIDKDIYISNANAMCDTFNSMVENGKKQRKNFVKPTIEEIEEYCKERNNNVDAETFYNFYESKGWVVGKSPMKDWKACVRTWEKSKPQVVEVKRVKKEKVSLPSWYDDYLKELDAKLEKKELEGEKVSQEEIDAFIRSINGDS